MIFWKLRKRPFKWCHQTLYLRDKSICQFGDTDYSPWSKAKKWQIRAPTKFWIETYNLNRIFLSFQKILKCLTLDQWYSSYGCWKMFNYNSSNGSSTFSAAITWIALKRFCDNYIIRTQITCRLSKIATINMTYVPDWGDCTPQANRASPDLQWWWGLPAYHWPAHDVLYASVCTPMSEWFASWLMRSEEHYVMLCLWVSSVLTIYFLPDDLL